MLEVCFIVVSTGVRVTKVFDSYPECRKFGACEKISVNRSSMIRVED